MRRLERRDEQQRDKKGALKSEAARGANRKRWETHSCVGLRLCSGNCRD